MNLEELIDRKALFQWSDVELGDKIIIEFEDGSIEKYQIINSPCGKWYDLLVLTSGELKYTPCDLSYSCVKSCIQHLYGDSSDLKEINLSKISIENQAINFAYNNGFKPRRKMTLEEIQKELGYEIELI
ncbi:hypothetical protein [Clostridium perfringens]|uniref:hypothetical protein n=1 Tax=Clostridium perfringens TaxID=1502 RepID=UPI00096AB4EA|nr:hypothetical protein [Clostridium perfringens]